MTVEAKYEQGRADARAHHKRTGYTSRQPAVMAAWVLGWNDQMAAIEAG